MGVKPLPFLPCNFGRIEGPDFLNNASEGKNTHKTGSVTLARRLNRDDFGFAIQQA